MRFLHHASLDTDPRSQMYLGHFILWFVYLKLNRAIKTYYSLSITGYRLGVCHVWFHSYWLIRAVSHAKKRELCTKWKLLATAGFEPTTSSLLYWCSNRLRYWGSDWRCLKLNDIHIPYYVFIQVQSKTINKIDFKFHFIIYGNLNVTVYCERFLQ